LTDRWIVGIDCAVDPRSVGVAAGVLTRNRLSLTDVKLCSFDCLPGATAAGYAKGRSDILFALDAPLGWPQSLGPELSRHEAGRQLEISADHLFRRDTDRFIRLKVGKQSLDVGADRIARTAWSTLNLLETISTELGEQIALAWNHSVEGAQAIEVYPAATLKAHGVLASGYKRPEQVKARQIIIDALLERMDIKGDRQLLRDSADAQQSVFSLGRTSFVGKVSFRRTLEAPRRKGGSGYEILAYRPAYNSSVEGTETAKRAVRRSPQHR
jgi:hypothetical protein